MQLFSLVPWLRICCYIGLTILWLFYIPVWIALLYFTTPSPGQTWLEGIQNPRYTKSLQLSVPISAVALCFDLALLILPITVVLQLQMSMQRKLGVSFMLLIGFREVPQLFYLEILSNNHSSACISSAVSVVYRVKQNREGVSDITWENFGIFFSQ